MKDFVHENGLYSIYDRVGEEFGLTFESKNDGTAKRMFDGWLKESNQSDYWLYRVGTISRARDSIEVVYLKQRVYDNADITVSLES